MCSCPNHVPLDPSTLKYPNSVPPPDFFVKYNICMKSIVSMGIVNEIIGVPLGGGEELAIVFRLKAGLGYRSFGQVSQRPDHQDVDLRRSS